MVDSPKITDFVDKARQNIDQIKIGLLRHDKNPKDREFLNDISKSVRSIKNSALPIGLPRITELCHNLESLIALIREEKKELHQEIIITIAACKDRLEKFIFELETVQKERSKVKDLVRRIQQHIDEYSQAESQNTEPTSTEEEISPEPTPSPPDERLSSLLPDEIKNREYDEELFQIFIEQVQENISLLRTLTDSYQEASNPTRIINRCSDLVGKLQSSANYMGYDALAEFYLQWVAELEMISVELSIGSDVSFDFMDEKIRLIADLFPEIKDVPADPAAIEEEPPLPPPSSEYEVQKGEGDAAAEDELHEMFSGIEEMEDEAFEDIEPVAALSEAKPPDEESPAAPADEQKTGARSARSRKQSRPIKKVEIDASYFEQEKASEDHDEELFQIFTEQLQENIARLTELNNKLATDSNKTKITEQCSNLLGKLQSSANYMGYERLVEYYLQWIAELEMAGVELSLGSDVSFDFMQEKIERIISIFPEIAEGEVLPKPEKSPAGKKADQPVAGVEEIPAESAPDEGATDEAGGVATPAGPAVPAEEEAETADVSPALAEENQAEGLEEQFDESYEDIDKTFETFFADIGEPEEDEEPDTSFMEIAASGEEEPISVETDTIAGISGEPDDDEEVAPALSSAGAGEEPEQLQDDAFSDALNEKLSSFFGDSDESELTDTAPAFAGRASSSGEEPASPAQMPADDDGMEGMFDDEEEEEEEEYSATAGADGEVAPALFEEEPEEVEPEEPGEFSEAVDEKLESFFTDIEIPEEDEELETSFMEIASLTEDEAEEEPAFSPGPAAGDSASEHFAEEETEDATADEMLRDIDVFFSEEDTAEPAVESASREGDASAGEHAESEITDEIEAIFAEEEPVTEQLAEVTGAPAGPEEMTGEIEAVFAAEESAPAPAGEPESPAEEAAEPVTDETFVEIENFFAEEEPVTEQLAEITGAPEETAPVQPAGGPESIAEEAAEPVTDETFDEIENFFAEEEPATEQPAEITGAPEETAPVQPAGAPESPAEEAAEPVTDETFDEIENFFAEEEPATEQLAELTGAPEEIGIKPGASTDEVEDSLLDAEPAAEKEAPESFDEIEALFAEESTAEGQAEESEVPAAGESEHVTEAAADELTDLLDAEDKAEPEAVELPAEEETEAVADEADDELDILFAEEAAEGAEEEEFAEPEAPAGEEFVAGTLSEEMLSDEELLEEIEGPTVGQEIPGIADSLEVPDLETAEQIASALPKDQTADEELFRKLEEAISAEEEPEDLEETADEEFAAGEELAETPPERRELYQKLSYALRSLEDEEGQEVEVTADKEEKEFDTSLYDRLASALDKPSARAEMDVQRPIDHVLEEILSAVPLPQKVHEPEPVSDDIPKQLAADEIKEIIRMDTGKVEQLMDQLGELNASRSTLTRLLAEMNELHQHYLEMEGFNKDELKPFKDILFRFSDTNVSLNRLSNEIREGILKVRMAPIGLLFERYPQLVEELAAKAGKQIDLEIVGEDTELEKLVIDDIAEPLTHIITNTIEHGIEPVAERRETGKEEAGKVRLEAYQEDNEIVIEVMDNGRGIDLKKVKAEALNKGLFSGDELYAMSDSDLARLILNPEFSTISDEGPKPAGRGEGLYIAGREIEKLKGTIDIRSTAGKGTIIQLRVPLNLLVVRALRVKAGKETMALPVNAIEEILKVRSDALHFDNGIGTVEFRGEMVPVHRLTEIFDIPEPEPGAEQFYIVIVQSEGETIGLIIDEPAGVEEIIIKPIGEFLRRESGFSGVTVISDGNLSLVPDTAELIRIITRQHKKEASLA